MFIQFMVQTGVLEREKGELIILYQVKSFHERPCQAHGDCGGPREQLPYLRSQHPWSSPRGTAVCCAKSRQSCLPLYDPMDCSPPASSVHGILQARILEWMPCPPPGGLPNPAIKPMSPVSSALAGGLFTTSATWDTF